ncbi:hypothetical protein R3P38DRAFT_2776512 [Favolaschia claudopus]|uniref:Uncharacterized protein n=1 Tax=Favolaschia claudopus TaxID=2862362 RepID=A0AAW0BLK1_9AGAR
MNMSTIMKSFVSGSRSLTTTPMAAQDEPNSEGGPDAFFPPYRLIWERALSTNGEVGYRCRPCNDLHVRQLRRLAAHESTQDHRNTLKYYLEARSETSDSPAQLPLQAFVADGTRSLLAPLAAPVGHTGGMPHGLCRN